MIRELGDCFNYNDWALNSNKIEESIEMMLKHDLKNIAINSEWGFKSKNLDFLKKYDWIEGVTIVGDGYDISVLNGLRNLKHLILNYNYKGSLDFSNFEFLKTCEIKWKNASIKNLENCKHLHYLGVFSFPEIEVSFIRELQELRCLKFFFGKIETLNGIEHLKALKKLYLHNLYSLRDIEAIKAIDNSLSDLFILNCNKISSYHPIGSLRKIETLFIENSNSTSNISFLENLDNLKKGYIGIEVLDGNLDFLKKKNLDYKKFKKYNLKHLN